MFVIVVFVFGALLYIYNPDPIEYKNPKEKGGLVCTMDAKLCPDGSYVGRTGPNCEFVCPIPKGALMPARLDSESVSGGEDGTVEP